MLLVSYTVIGLAEVPSVESSAVSLPESRDLLASYGEPGTNSKLQVFANEKNDTGDTKLQAYGDDRASSRTLAVEDGRLATYGADGTDKLGAYTSEKRDSGDNKLLAYTSPNSASSAGRSAVLPVVAGGKPPPGPAKSKYITEHVRDWNADFQVCAVFFQQLLYLNPAYSI